MFHDSHELNRIVADFLNARQDVVGERPVSVDLALGRTEAISDVKINFKLQYSPFIIGLQITRQNFR